MCNGPSGPTYGDHELRIGDEVDPALSPDCCGAAMTRGPLDRHGDRDHTCECCGAVCTYTEYEGEETALVDDIRHPQPA